LFGIVRARADEHRTRSIDGSARVCRSLGVLVRKRQPVVQSSILAPQQLGPSPLQYLRIADTDVHDVVDCRNFNQLAEI
jgi:hypothetical protein